ncbi:hypothetical protein [Photobacterium chitinilyticum]|uniref:DUF2069 domain-containing protein n=1 Tax=Photobacterium chitinilyticum TaxID=2485123 RepID=A0A3S3QS31_9GAMM|nr:hypothetical protein [Photobacterium chitinilyticum]RWX57492.1 hypothetical protein EDI28_05590 [Photobacterium chitinilyticum]
MNEKTGTFRLLGLLLPVVLSFWLLAAHFLRSGNLLWFGLLLVLPLLLVVKRSYIARSIQFGLLVATITWVQITYQMLMSRMMMGDDWQRMAIIMGAVICFTLLSACTFLHSELERRYGLK